MTRLLSGFQNCSFQYVFQNCRIVCSNMGERKDLVLPQRVGVELEVGAVDMRRQSWGEALGKMIA